MPSVDDRERRALDVELDVGDVQRDLGAGGVLVAELPPPAIRAVDERLVVAGELEPQVGTVAGELDTALLAGDCERLEHNPQLECLKPGGIVRVRR